MPRGSVRGGDAENGPYVLERFVKHVVGVWSVSVLVENISRSACAFPVIGQDVYPILRAHAPVPGPQPEDFAHALAGHGQNNVDRPVRNLPVTDLHMYAVYEDDRVERTVLPLGHAFDGLAGDRGDALLGVRTIDLPQMGADRPVCKAAGGEREHHLADLGQPLLALLDELRLERAGPVSWHLDLHGTPHYSASSSAAAAGPRAHRTTCSAAPPRGSLLLERSPAASSDTSLEKCTGYCFS